MFGMVPFRGGNVARRKDPWDMGSVFESFFKDSLFPTLFSNNGLMKVDILKMIRITCVTEPRYGQKEIYLESKILC